MKKYLLLPALIVPAALAWKAPADSVAFHPESGSALTRTFVSTSEMTLDDMSMSMNGNPSPMPLEMEMTINMEQTVTVSDVYDEVDGSQVQKLTRTFDELGSSGSFAMEMAMADQSMDRVIEAESELEGKTVQFVWNEDDGEFSVEFPDEDGDEDLLEGLEQDMDLTALLPSEDVSEGDTWDIDVTKLRSLLLPGGNLALEPLLNDEEEEMMGSMGMDGMNDLSNMIGDLEGEATGEYAGTRDVDGTSCGVINVTFNITTANDLTDTIEGAMDGMPEGAEVEIDHIDVEMEMDGEGVLLWNLSAGTLHSFEMSAEVETTMDMGMAMSMGEMNVDIEQTMDMSGSQGLTVTTASN